MLLQDDFDLTVVWRGGRDYCGYHSSGKSVVHGDKGSAVREVYDRFHNKEDRPGKDGHTHRDSISTPFLFENEFRKALVHEGSAFTDADLAFCSEPALVCAVMHEGGKPLIGYFGVHI